MQMQHGDAGRTAGSLRHDDGRPGQTVGLEIHRQQAQVVRRGFERHGAGEEAGAQRINGMGPDMRLSVVNDAGQPSRGWVDYPGRIWIWEADQGAIYSPDGLTIQFDRGTIWQRAPLVPPPRR